MKTKSMKRRAGSMADTAQESHSKRAKASEAPDFSGEIISIAAGGDSVLRVHKQLIVNESRFVATRFSLNWNTDMSSDITFEEADTPLLKVFVQWLYTRKIYTRGDKPEKRYQKDDLEWDTLFALYIMGEYLQAARFCNDVMHALCDKAQFAKLIIFGRTSWVYPRTVVGSPLRSFLVDMHLYWGRAKHVKDDCSDPDMTDTYKAEFLADIVDEMIIRMDGPFGSFKSAGKDDQAESFKPATTDFPSFAGPWVERYLLKEEAFAFTAGSTPLASEI